MLCMSSVIRMVTTRKHSIYKKQYFGVHHAQSIKHRHNVYTDSIITLIKVFILSCYFLPRTIIKTKSLLVINPFSYHSILTLKIKYFVAEVVLKDSILFIKSFSVVANKSYRKSYHKSHSAHISIVSIPRLLAVHRNLLINWSLFFASKNEDQQLI